MKKNFNAQMPSRIHLVLEQKNVDTRGKMRWLEGVRGKSRIGSAYGKFEEVISD